MASSGDGHPRCIADWLASINLQEYLPLMERERIDLDSLTGCSENDLEKIGICHMGDRKKILRHVKRTLLTEVSGTENASSKSEESVLTSSNNEPSFYGVSGIGNTSSNSEGRLTTSSNSEYFQYENPPLSRLDNEIRIAIIGKTGCGKSATANTILGEKKFLSKPQFSSLTSGCSSAHTIRFDDKIVIVDTPGICDTGRNDEDVQKQIAQCVTITAPGPHAFILVLGINRYTKEDNDAVQHFIKYFGEGIYEYFIVLFTGKDELDRANMTLKDAIKDAPKQLKEFIDKCQGRVVVFDNTRMGNEQTDQVRGLLNMIKRNVSRNHDRHYTHKMYEIAEEMMRKHEEEIEAVKKEKWEKEKQKIEAETQKKNQEVFNKQQAELKQAQHKINDLEIKQCKNNQEDRERKAEIEKLKQRMQKLKEDAAKSKQKMITEKLARLEKGLCEQYRKEAEQKSDAAVFNFLASSLEFVTAILNYE